MTSTPVQPHVLLVSSPLQSHIEPLMRLGRCLAARGLLVTFTTALRAGVRLVDRDVVVDGKEGCRGKIRVELLRGGGMWEPEDPRFRVAEDMTRHIEAAGPAALEELILREAGAGRPVTCVVANAFVPWALRVAGDMGLPRAMLWIQSCAVLSVYYHYVHSLADFPEEADRCGSVTIPGLPELLAGELRPLLIYQSSHNLWRNMLFSDLGSTQETASWVFVNTFDELEHEAIAGLCKHMPVIPVGPLTEPDQNCKLADDNDGYIAWLNAQPPRSVVFVAFGSLVTTGDDETTEIAEGLASTGRPFLWVLRDDNRALLSPDALDGIMATCCGGGKAGKVVPWCKQVDVLAHAAVGCFVTHAGWNSTTEVLAAGVPVVACPRWSDQRINTQLLVDVYGVGVRGSAPVTKEALRLSVDEVMSGPQAETIGIQAASWKARARVAVADGGSSDRAIQDFVEQIAS